GQTADKASFDISVGVSFNSLAAADLDGDGLIDLAGASVAGGTALWALLDEAGKVGGGAALPAGNYPTSVVVARIDEDGIPDLAVPCSLSNHVAVFLGQSGGGFQSGGQVPVAFPIDAAFGDLDGDGRPDLVATSPRTAVLAQGKGG